MCAKNREQDTQHNVSDLTMQLHVQHQENHQFCVHFTFITSTYYNHIFLNFLVVRIMLKEAVQIKETLEEIKALQKNFHGN